MKEYSFTEARQNLASLLEEAKKDGGVCIRKRNGDIFYLKPADNQNSPLDVQGADLNVDANEIVEAVREGRERYRF